MVVFPSHARRAHQILGYVPKPDYEVLINDQWLGEFHEVPGGERVFTPTVFHSSGKADKKARKFARKVRGEVEVVESFGSFPQDRVTVKSYKGTGSRRFDYAVKHGKVVGVLV